MPESIKRILVTPVCVKEEFLCLSKEQLRQEISDTLYFHNAWTGNNGETSVLDQHLFLAMVLQRLHDFKVGALRD